MRLRYHQLVGKRVATSDGKDVGRVYDLEANPEGGHLYVTGLLLGPTELFRRIAFRVPVQRIPWQLVSRVGGRIQLKVTEAELRRTPREYD